MSHYYTVDLNPPCIGFNRDCHAKATVEVFNTWNASRGKFCQQCADEAIEFWKKEGGA